MKQLLIILFLADLLFSGCSNKPELKKEEAMQLIAIQFKYPKLIDYDIYCSDPSYAKKLLDAGFEENGMVIIQKTQKLKDIGSPLIGFTERAKTYFLPTSSKDIKLDIQKVKIADEVITGINIIDTENQITTVEFITTYKNYTPFAALLNMQIKKPKKHTVYFTFSNKGWQVERSAHE